MSGAEVIAEYIRQRAVDKLEQKKLQDSFEGGLSEEERTERDKFLMKFEPTTWIQDAAIRAKQITICTHPAKFSHPDSKGLSFYDNSAATGIDPKAPYLCSSSLLSFQRDVSGNAAALDVAKFLLLQVDGTSLIERLVQGEIEDLLPFAENPEQAEQWREAFSKVVAVAVPISDTLSKQVYFPVTQEVGKQSYHVLCPLYPSSLAAEVAKRIELTRFSEEAKEIRETRRKRQFHNKADTSYPRISKQHFGGTKPQNISLLNSSRGFPLLNSEPPVWTSQDKPPSLRGKDALWSLLTRRARTPLQLLRNFIVRNKHRSSNLNLREERKELVDQVVDCFVLLTEEYRARQEPGWSSDTDLDRSEKFLLDPQNPDPNFQSERSLGLWQEQVAERFATWFNSRLSTKFTGVVLDDQHYHEWKRLVQKELEHLSEEEK